MKLYAKLSKVGFLKGSYAFKFLFVAFLGIHLPLIAIIFFVLFFENAISPRSIFLLTLGFTLLATFLTLLGLKKLVKPIQTASKALEGYRSKRTIPKLPLHFTDEAGLLLSNIQGTIKSSESLIHQKEDMIYLISHDLRNHVAKTAGLCGLILEENPSAKVAEYTGMIRDVTESQSNFIESFVTLMRQEEELAAKTLRVKSVHFNNLVRTVQSRLAEPLQAKNISLTADGPSEEIYLKIEPDMLASVLMNLVENAIKFSHPGSEIKIKASKHQAHFELSVTDKGIGFENLDSNELFKKFTKWGRKGTAGEKSNGIGLYLCSQIIKKSDGQLYAESAGAGQGATFSISLRIYHKHKDGA